MENVHIVCAKRSAVGSYYGSLSKLPATIIGSQVVIEMKEELELSNNDISEFIIGQCLVAGQGQNPARQTALLSGFSHSTNAFTINMVCGSGLKSIVMAFNEIRLNDDGGKIIIAGGQENMSFTPHLVFARNPLKFGNGELIDSMKFDGLTDAFHKVAMGETAEQIVDKYKITREAQDIFAYNSHMKYFENGQNGFKEEITPIKLIDMKKLEKFQQDNLFSSLSIVPFLKDDNTSKLFSEDEGPRKDTSIEKLRKLRPYFRPKSGTVTPGSSSTINDGAAFLCLTSENEMKKRNWKSLGRIVTFGQSGCNPIIMGIAPVEAIKKCLKKANWKLSEVDIFELNEAFAAQSLAVIKELDIELKKENDNCSGDCSIAQKVNICGGAIAIGHPIGASGARVLVTLIHLMKRKNLKKGIAALCIGGGQAIAVAIENCL
ncbi:hypothetical protein SNEBB_005072 [Seison nebaliae]|nr:hypothetical protein SNEBB_005072 [Seison nebaliae]